MQKICYVHVSSCLCKNAKKIIHVHQKCGKHHILTDSVVSRDIFIYANRKKAEHREVLKKKVVWIILRSGIFHGLSGIRSGFPSYAQKLCALTLLAYAFNVAAIL